MATISQWRVNTPPPCGKKAKKSRTNTSKPFPSRPLRAAGTIWMGFYIGDERLPITQGDKPNHDGSNRIRVGTITVAKP